MTKAESHKCAGCESTTIHCVVEFHPENTEQVLMYCEHCWATMFCSLIKPVADPDPGERCPTKHICGHTCALVSGHEGNHVDAAHFVQWEDGGYPHSLGHRPRPCDRCGAIFRR